MPAYTEHTFTDPDALAVELSRIASQGFALDEAEQELGVRCVAVAVPGAPVPAAVSVSGPSGRLTAEAVAHIAPAVQRVADALGASLSQAVTV
jgi:IclR family acetate operon transcriptional repressor